MQVKIHESWNQVLNEEFSKDYFQNLIEFVKIFPNVFGDKYLTKLEDELIILDEIKYFKIS